MDRIVPAWVIVIIVIASILLIYVGLRCLFDRNDDEK